MVIAEEVLEEMVAGVGEEMVAEDRSALVMDIMYLEFLRTSEG